MKTITPAMTEVMKSPSMYPVIDRDTSAEIRLSRSARSAGSIAMNPTLIFGASSRRRITRMKISNDVEDRRERRLSEPQHRAGEILRVGGQLRLVLLQPALKVEVLKLVADPALSLLRLLYVAGKLAYEIGESRDQGDPEQEGEAREDPDTEQRRRSPPRSRASCGPCAAGGPPEGSG